jgi:hypothetical protein
MVPHVINDKKNFISGWYIDKKLCESIVESSSGKNRLKFNGDRKKTVKGYLLASLKDLSTELQTQYQLELDKVINLYMEEYPHLKEIKKLEAVTVQVQVYDPAHSYSILHCENDGSPLVSTRCLVFMTYLNDVTDDGETEFYHQQLKVKPEKGLTLIWPADWTFTHRGITSLTEEKYIVTGWYNFINKGN